MSQPDDNRDRRQFVVRGIMALFAARVLSLPAGEYVIHLDTRHASRTRWKIGQMPQPWEFVADEDDAPRSG